ncbi:TetR/AcrR family transcriptional regulator [Catellatospora coxensis]
MECSRERQSDPGRSLALLWGSHTRPGRSGLTVRAIVDAAIELADAEGLEAATMRRVADKIGSGTMSLYTHVPGKAELNDLMVDTVLGELYNGVDDPSGRGGWREGLRYVAERNWDVGLRHLWLLDATGGRPTLGPNAVLKYEAELRVLDGIGLTDLQMDSVLTLVLTHVEGVARSHAGLVRAQRESGLDEQEWWRATAPSWSASWPATTFRSPAASARPAARSTRPPPTPPTPSPSASTSSSTASSAS